MRDIPVAMRQAFARGVTTHCRCWSLARSDGVVLGFTDHDRPLEFDGIVFEARSGLDAGAVETSAGLNVDTHTVRGALSSEAITEADIERGFYDGAVVTLWLVDWTDVASRMLLSRGAIGETRRAGSAFEAEIASLSERLNQTYGRAFLHSCDRRLGDARCGVDLSLPIHRATGAVTGVTDLQTFVVSGLEAFGRGWFDGGGLTWLSGANAGVSGHVKTYLGPGNAATIQLWLAPPLAVEPGDSFTMTAGCDKTLATCKGKFANLLNFRGFPYMPGDDWAAGYVGGEGEHDGGSLFRR